MLISSFTISAMCQFSHVHHGRCLDTWFCQWEYTTSSATWLSSSPHCWPRLRGAPGEALSPQLGLLWPLGLHCPLRSSHTHHNFLKHLTNRRTRNKAVSTIGVGFRFYWRRSSRNFLNFKTRLRSCGLPRYDECASLLFFEICSIVLEFGNGFLLIIAFLVMVVSVYSCV